MSFDLLSDADLVKNIQNNENLEPSLNLLESRYSGIFHYTINNYTSGNTGHYEYGEFIDHRKTFVYETAQKYDFDRNAAFNTYFTKKCKWACGNIKRKIKNNISEIPVEEHFSLTSPLNAPEEKHQFYDFVIHDMQDKYSERDCEIFQLYLQGLTLEEIGNRFGITRERTRQIYQQILDKYKAILVKEN